MPPHHSHSLAHKYHEKTHEKKKFTWTQFSIAPQKETWTQLIIMARTLKPAQKFWRENCDFWKAKNLTDFGTKGPR